MRATILHILLLPIVLFSCDNNSQSERSIESTIKKFLIAVQKQDGEDDFDYSKLSSFIITNEEYSEVQSQLDFKNYEDYRENLGDELADVFIEAEELGLDFSKINKLTFTSIWDDKEKIHDGQCNIKFNGHNELYELNAHLIRVGDNWKIISIEDLTSTENKSSKKKPNIISGEDDGINDNIEWFGEWVHKEEYFSESLIIDPRATSDKGREVYNMCQLTGEGVQMSYTISLIGIKGSGNISFEFYYDETIDGVYRKRFDKSKPIVSLKYENGKVISYFYHPDDVDDSSKEYFKKVK